MSLAALLAVPPVWVWGLFTRLVGLVFLVSYVSLLRQVVPLVGQNGISPAARKLAQMRADFSLWRCIAYWPTLLWFGASDRALRALVWSGIAASIFVIVGGPFSFPGLCICYVAYLSLDVPIQLNFPWDAALFETAFLGLFLPPTLLLPHIEAVSAPDPALAWAYRLLLFRILFGFGKLKFIGASREDSGFLKGFLVNQPLPSPLAWYGHKLPLVVLKVGLVCLFIVEIPLTVLALVPGVPSLIAAASIVALMLVIQLSGTFGYFNLIVIVLCVPLLDSATVHDLHLAQYFTFAGAAGAIGFTFDGPWLLRSVVLLQTLGAVLCFPFNSYFAHGWHQWVVWFSLKHAWMRAPAAFYRALHPLRWLHPYGVFPPKSMADVRCVMVAEVSWDREHWHELEYKFASSKASAIPGFIAPYHARWDQSVVYMGFGVPDCGFVVPGVLTAWQPHLHARYTEAHCLLQRILEGHTFEGFVFKRGSFPKDRGSPVAARMRSYMLVPTTLEERKRTGNWWTRTVIGPHIAAMERVPHFWDHWLPTAELFHWEGLLWKRRSRLSALRGRVERGEPMMQALLADSPDLRAPDVDAYFDDFLPAANLSDREEWASLPETVAALAQRFDAAELRVFERIHGRLGALLEAKLEPLVLGHGLTPPLGVQTHMEAGLLIQTILGDGRDAFEAAFADPKANAERVPGLRLASGMYLWVVFKFDLFTMEAQKIRMLDAMFGRESERDPQSPKAKFEKMLEVKLTKVWGVLPVTQLLRERFRGPAYDHGVPERYPEFQMLPSGDILHTPAREGDTSGACTAR